MLSQGLLQSERAEKRDSRFAGEMLQQSQVFLEII